MDTLSDGSLTCQGQGAVLPCELSAIVAEAHADILRNAVTVQ